MTADYLKDKYAPWVPADLEQWEACGSAYNLMQAVGDAHVRDALTRQRLVQVALRCVEVGARWLPDTVLTALADLTAWAHGDDDVDPAEVRQRLFASYVAAPAGIVGDVGFALSVAYAAAAQTPYSAVAFAANPLGRVDDAWCDVIRDEITYENAMYGRETLQEQIANNYAVMAAAKGE